MRGAPWRGLQPYQLGLAVTVVLVAVAIWETVSLQAQFQRRPDSAALETP